MIPQIRDATDSDASDVFAIHEAAFGRQAEAHLVQALGSGVSPALSLVASLDGRPLGHVFVSPVRIEGPDDAPKAGGLAPLGVLPDAQRQGVGAALVRAALSRAPSLGWRAIFLLGSPAYYGRFGFCLVGPQGLHYESAAYDTAFHGVALEAGALAGIRGTVRYPAAFDALDD